MDGIDPDQRAQKMQFNLGSLLSACVVKPLKLRFILVSVDCIFHCQKWLS